MPPRWSKVSQDQALVISTFMRSLRGFTISLCARFCCNSGYSKPLFFLKIHSYQTISPTVKLSLLRIFPTNRKDSLSEPVALKLIAAETNGSKKIKNFVTAAI